jgi:hypothetical protein
MKKLALIIVILLIGVMNCSKSDKEEKTNENKTINAPVKSDEKKENYEAEIVQRMDAVKKEVQPALDSGITADMNNAVQKLGDSWETEMRKVYELLLAELPENEKTKLQKEQEEWVKKVKEDVEKITEESEGGTISGTLGGNAWASGIEERTLELAKRYDKIHKK